MVHGLSQVGRRNVSSGGGGPMVERFDARKVEDSPFKVILDEQSLAWNEARTIARGAKPRSLYASDYGQCMRKVFFQFFPLEYPVSEDVDPRMMRIFHNGEQVHERLQSYLANAGILFQAEVDVPRDDLDIHGRCDAVALLENRFYVLEFKSINLPSIYQIKEEHRGQCSWYMWIWEKRRAELRAFWEIPEGIALEESELQELVGLERWNETPLVDRMLLLSTGEVLGEVIYESKGTQALTHFPLQIDQGFITKVRLWYQQLKLHIDAKIVPEVRYDRSKFPCQFGSAQSRCQFWGLCHGGKTES